MNEPRKSDSPIVPMKAPNKAGQPAAEAVEGRGLAKGNPPQQNAPRTQCRPGASSALERVRQAVAQDGTYPCCAQSWRHHLRQEPDAVVPHVRIRGGGHGQPWSLLRPSPACACLCRDDRKTGSQVCGLLPEVWAKGMTGWKARPTNQLTFSRETAAVRVIQIATW